MTMIRWSLFSGWLSWWEWGVKLRENGGRARGEEVIAGSRGGGLELGSYGEPGSYIGCFGGFTARLSTLLLTTLHHIYPNKFTQGQLDQNWCFFSLKKVQMAFDHPPSFWNSLFSDIYDQHHHPRTVQSSGWITSPSMYDAVIRLLVFT